MIHYRNSNRAHFSQKNEITFTKGKKRPESIKRRSDVQHVTIEGLKSMSLPKRHFSQAKSADIVHQFSFRKQFGIVL